MKKFLAGVFAAVMMMSASVFADDVNVKVNGELVEFTGQEPVIENGRTLISIRGVFDRLGYMISWESKTKRVTLMKGKESVIVITVGDNNIVVNDEIVYSDAAPQIINGYTMIPLRIIGEAAHAEVNWDEASKTAEILYDDTGIYDETDDEGRFLKRYDDIFKEVNSVMEKYSEGWASVEGSVTNPDVPLEESLAELKKLKPFNEEAIARIQRAKADAEALDCPDETYEVLKSKTVYVFDGMCEILELDNKFIEGKIGIDEYAERYDEISGNYAEAAQELNDMVDMKRIKYNIDRVYG